MLSIERKRELLDAVIMLNGERAKLSGVQKRFATVTQVRTGLSCEFSWETAEHIITTKLGCFES